MPPIEAIGSPSVPQRPRLHQCRGSYQLRRFAHLCDYLNIFMVEAKLKAVGGALRRTPYMGDHRRQTAKISFWRFYRTAPLG